MKGNLEQLTLDNQDYRRVLTTTPYMQIILMSLVPGEDVPAEIHEYNTQFVRVEQGLAFVRVGDNEYVLKDGDFVVIPPGAEHYIANDSEETLKLYTIYSPPEHPKDLIQKEQPN